MTTAPKAPPLPQNSGISNGSIPPPPPLPGMIPKPPPFNLGKFTNFTYLKKKKHLIKLFYR